MAEWRPIRGYEGYYEVSDEGDVRSTRRKGSRGAVLSAGTTKNGYKLVSLWRDGKGTSCNVHRLVAAAFIGECPTGLEVRHLDGNPANNAVGNLAYGTGSENCRDTIAHGRNYWLSKTHCPQGHEYSVANTYHEPGTGYRRCRTCIGMRQLEVVE